MLTLNPNQKNWGIGQIQSIINNKITVNFENAGKKVINNKLIVLEKIKKLKLIQKEKNINFDIEIDGGINFENSKIAIEAGANILVSGTTIFKSNNGDIKKNIELLKSQ